MKSSEQNRNVSTTRQVPALTAMTGITEEEVSIIVDEIEEASDIRPKGKRVTYKETDKIRIVRYANLHSLSRAVKHFANEFPKLTESTIRPWLKRYREQLKQNSIDKAIPQTIGQKQGRPFRLPDTKLRNFLINFKTAGGTVNRNVVYGTLVGFIKSTNGWVDYLYRRLNFSRRCSTTLRPAITRIIWNEVRHIFLHDIAEAVIKYNIPDELILNVDQTPSKYVSVDRITMAEKGSKHVSKKGVDDKRAITVTLSETLSCHILLQLIYTGKTKRSLPNVSFPKGFSLSCNPTHWSNEKETLRLLDEVIVPYIDEVKERKNLPENQKCLLVWDAFKAQECPAVLRRLQEFQIITVQVPKNLTHLLQPLDLTTNLTFKKLEKESFTEYFSNTVAKEMAGDPNRDVTTIDIDLYTYHPLLGTFIRYVTLLDYFFDYNYYPM